MNKDFFHRQHHRGAPRFDEQDRQPGNRSRYANPSRDDNAERWNDAQTARWLSHYGGAAQREGGHRFEDERSEYAMGYGHRDYDNPRYGQRYQEVWEGSAPDEAWRQRSAERISPGMHGRYGWRGEDADQGSLDFQPGERGYASNYGPTYGSTYRRAEGFGGQAGGQREHGDYGWPRSNSWSDDHHYPSQQPRRGMYHGKGPSGYTRSDERIREDVCDRLTDDPDVDASGIQVSVESGVVTLQGQVAERQMKHRAEDCVERVSGVRDVENRLRVAPEENTWGDASDTDEDRGSSFFRKKS